MQERQKLTYSAKQFIGLTVIKLYHTTIVWLSGMILVYFKIFHFYLKAIESIFTQDFKSYSLDYR